MDNIAKQAMKTVPTEGSVYTCTIEEYGVFDNVVLRESTRRTPEAGQVEIQIKASALNFRDIMIAMGLLSDDAVNGGSFGKTLCLEYAGISTKVGTDVTNVKVVDNIWRR